MVADAHPEDPMADEHEAEHQHAFHIQIDRVHFVVHQEDMTGAQIRTVPTPPIDATRDLYEVVPGEQDLLIEDTTVVEMRDGLRFFTAPHNINPGRTIEG
jgi:hypothetical protein